MNRLLSLIVGLLWVMAAVKILFDIPYLADIMVVLVLVFLALGLIRMPRHTLILCGALVAVMLPVAEYYGQWSAVIDGLVRASVFPAFLATIVLLRAAADQRPEIASARRLFGALPANERDSGVVIGTHLIGSVLQVGVFGSWRRSSARMRRWPNAARCSPPPSGA